MKKAMRKVLDSRTGEMRSLELVGYYGTFNDPVVSDERGEYVAELCYVDSQTGKQVGTVCQSNGCCWCDKSACGCRLAEENASYDQVLVI